MPQKERKSWKLMRGIHMDELYHVINCVLLKVGIVEVKDLFEPIKEIVV